MHFFVYYSCMHSKTYGTMGREWVVFFHFLDIGAASTWVGEGEGPDLYLEAHTI